MCHNYAAIGASALGVAVAAYLYEAHDIGLNQALGGLLATEVIVAVGLIMWIALFVRRAHAPERVVEHVHTHPLHNKHDHQHDPGPVWPTRAYQVPRRDRS